MSTILHPFLSSFGFFLPEGMNPVRYQPESFRQTPPHTYLWWKNEYHGAELQETRIGKGMLGQEGHRMGVLGKVVAAKAVKGRRDEKKKKTEEAEKTEEKK